MSTTTTALGIDALKTRLKETWMAGDYDRFSRYVEQGARVFYEQLDIPAGCQLLDVACGSGQVALWAARDGMNAGLQSGRHDRHGKLDGRRIRGTNVQNLRQVHRSLGHASAGALGRRESGAGEVGARGLGA